MEEETYESYIQNEGRRESALCCEKGETRTGPRAVQDPRAQVESVGRLRNLRTLLEGNSVSKNRAQARGGVLPGYPPKTVP